MISTWLVPVLAGISILLAITVAFLLSRQRKTTQDNVSAGLIAGIERVQNRIDAFQNMADEVHSLSRLFTLPRLRGAAGEILLENLLGTWLPSRGYSLQHSFRSGARADAVVRLGAYLVAVDSKFPLEAYARYIEQNGAPEIPGNLKRVFIGHAREIADKYIRTDENTLNFALMYIPSEAVYYNIFIAGRSDLLDDILALNVVPVSPGSLFLYLQTVAYGLRGLVLNEKGIALSAVLAGFRTDLDTLKKSYATASTHLRNLNRILEDHGKQLDAAERGLLSHLG